MKDKKALPKADKKDKVAKETFTSKLDRMTDKLGRLDNQYLVLKNFWALTCILLAFMILLPLRREGDGAKFFLVLFGFGFILLSLGLIVEFIVKTARLQVDPLVKRYSAIVSLNSFFGLIAPLAYINYTLGKVIFMLSRIRTDNKFACELKCSIVDTYFENNVAWYLDKTIFFLVIMSIALFMFGGVIERSRLIKD
jgi:hypothetical protein